MSHQVLVLNADYSAINICTVPKAFLLVYLDKAEMIAKSDILELRSVTNMYAFPVIIKLNRYVNVPYKHVELTRQNIFKRDRYQCQYCGKKSHLTLDHILPKSKGGRTTWDNLITACKKCNSRKGDSSPEEAGMILKKQPFRPSFVMFVRDFSGKVNEAWLPYLNRTG